MVFCTIVLALVGAAVSPDGKNEIRLYGAPLACEVVRGGTVVMAKTPIGLKVDGRWLEGGSGRVSARRLAGEVRTPVYKKEKVDLSANETLVGFGNWSVRLIARDDAVAYRFELDRDGEVVVDEERADVTVPRDGDRCLVYSTDRIGCEESVPERLDWRETKRRIAEKTVYLPFVYETAGGTVAVTESDVRDYPIWNLGSRFARAPKKVRRARERPGDFNAHVAVEKGGRWIDVEESEPYLVRTAGRRTFPWRLFLLADSPAKLVESDAVYALAAPAGTKDDFSWVRPGKVAWDWWNGFDNQGPKGCNTATYLRFVDFAATNGIEYVILDEGWSEALDIWKFNPEVDVPRIVRHAADKGVGIILWLAWAQAFGDEAHVAEHFARMDVRGFKVDFMDRGDAAVSRFLASFAAECAKRRLLVDFHGVYRPVGLQRRYPNVVNYEGVHGLENLKWHLGRDMTFNEVAAVFGRMTAGPLDFTPGAMDNYRAAYYPRAFGAGPGAMSMEESEKFCYSPGSIGTRARQLAMLVVYEAPLQMLCDAPTKYGRNGECLAFMAKVPTVWTKTVGLGGSSETYAAVARQAADGSWAVGVLNGSAAREVELDLSFLGDGDWEAEEFCDNLTDGMSPSSYRHRHVRLDGSRKVSVRMAEAGGYAARVTRKGRR